MNGIFGDIFDFDGDGKLDIIPGFRPVSRAGSFFAQKYDFFTQGILDSYPLYCVTL